MSSPRSNRLAPPRPSWANLDATWIFGSTRVYRNNRGAVEEWRDLQLPSRRHEPSTADSWDFLKSRSPKPYGGEVVFCSRSVIARCTSARRRASNSAQPRLTLAMRSATSRRGGNAWSLREWKSRRECPSRGDDKESPDRVGCLPFSVRWDGWPLGDRRSTL